MILDACRTNPITKQWTRDFNNTGLAPMSGKGSFIGFAAAPGTTASDGADRNGTYTEAILRNMMVQNSSIDQIFTRVNQYVRTKTFDRQIPFKSSSLSVDFCFNLPKFSKSESSKLGTNNYTSDRFLISPNDDKLYILDNSNNSILQFDEESLLCEDTISIENYTLYRFVIAKEGRLYLIDRQRKIFARVDNGRTTILSLELKGNPNSFSMLPDESKAFVGYSSSDTTGDLVVQITLRYIRTH